MRKHLLKNLANQYKRLKDASFIIKRDGTVENVVAQITDGPPLLRLLEGIYIHCGRVPMRVLHYIEHDLLFVINNLSLADLSKLIRRLKSVWKFPHRVLSECSKVLRAMETVDEPEIPHLLTLTIDLMELEHTLGTDYGSTLYLEIIKKYVRHCTTLEELFKVVNIYRTRRTNDISREDVRILKDLILINASNKINQCRMRSMPRVSYLASSPVCVNASRDGSANIDNPGTISENTNIAEESKEDISTDMKDVIFRVSAQVCLNTCNNIVGIMDAISLSASFGDHSSREYLETVIYPVVNSHALKFTADSITRIVAFIKDVGGPYPHDTITTLTNTYIKHIAQFSFKNMMLFNLSLLDMGVNNYYAIIKTATALPRRLQSIDSKGDLGLLLQLHSKSKLDSQYFDQLISQIILQLTYKLKLDKNELPLTDPVTNLHRRFSLTI